MTQGDGEAGWCGGGGASLVYHGERESERPRARGSEGRERARARERERRPARVSGSPKRGRARRGSEHASELGRHAARVT